MIDPAKGAGANFAQRTETLVQAMRGAGQERQPGDRRYQQRAESDRLGVALQASEWQALLALAGTA